MQLLVELLVKSLGHKVGLKSLLEHSVEDLGSQGPNLL